MNSPKCAESQRQIFRLIASLIARRMAYAAVNQDVLHDDDDDDVINVRGGTQSAAAAAFPVPLERLP